MPTSIEPQASERATQIYATYNLYYNNVTYRAVRAALDEAAQISRRSDHPITELFIAEVMNALIDASFERLGAITYRGAEAKLRDLLRPLDSYLTSLALRHLANFGRSLVIDYPPPLHDLIEELQITRAELSMAEQEARCQDSNETRLASAWLKAAVLLIGAAADRLSDGFLPGTVWRTGAQEKFIAAVVALKDSVTIAHDEHYALSPRLRDTLAQMLELLTVPDNSTDKS
jgi:hypothetical protein